MRILWKNYDLLGKLKMSFYDNSDALNELFLKISVPLENVPRWENDLFLWNFDLAGRIGTDLKTFYFHFYI